MDGHGMRHGYPGHLGHVGYYGYGVGYPNYWEQQYTPFYPTYGWGHHYGYHHHW